VKGEKTKTASRFAKRRQEKKRKRRGREAAVIGAVVREDDATPKAAPRPEKDAETAKAFS
jgi:hypothetical protein